MVAEFLIKKGDLWRAPMSCTLANTLPDLCKWSTPLTYCADIFVDDTTIGTSSHSIDTLVETLTTDLQNGLSLCISHLDTNSKFLQIVIVYVIVKYKLALLKNFLVSQLVILSAGMLILNSLFYLEGTEYCFTTLTFYLILISVVLSGVTVVLHWKINLSNSKRGQHEKS